MPVLPAFSGLLLERDKPVALACGRVGNEVGVGRAGAPDDKDSAQKRDPAARSVRALSGPIRR